MTQKAIRKTISLTAIVNSLLSNTFRTYPIIMITIVTIAITIE